MVLQIGFAGYGAFYVANKVDGEGKTIDEDRFDGRLRDPHRASATSSGCSGSCFLVIGIAAGIGRWRLGRHGVLFLLLTLQILLAWFGCEVPAIGSSTR